MAQLDLPWGGHLEISGDDRDGSVFLPIVHTRSYEPHVIGLLPRLVDEHSVVIDAGANLGVIALALAQLVPHGRVIAFEPSPHNVAFLETNVAANSADNVTVVSAALSDAEGVVHLRMDDTFQGGAHLATAPTGTDVAVPAITLDQWATSGPNPLDRLDVLKIDVEGAERAVLAGAAGVIARHRPTLLVEVNALALLRMGDSAEALWRDVAGLYRHRYVVEESGRLLAVFGWNHLVRRLRHRGSVDLLCTMRPFPGARRGDGVRNALGTWIRQRRAGGSEPAVLLSADYELLPQVSSLAARPGQQVTVAVTIVNRTGQFITSEWPRAAVNLSYHLLDDAGGARRDGLRTALPLISPGASVTVDAALQAPDQPGRYVARLSLVQEACAWGDELGFPGTVVELVVK